MKNEITTIYLIRHSNKISEDFIDSYNVDDTDQVKTEKKLLSVQGEIRAKILSEQEEFKDVQKVYSSNYVRAMSTAKYFCERLNLRLNVDKRFNERRKGHYDKIKYPDFFTRQYYDISFKSEDGECQKEVFDRMYDGFLDVLKDNKGKKVVIVSHGTAISFLLMHWCKLLNVQDNLLRKLEFNGHIVINRIYNSPEVFKLTLKDDEVINIESILFDDLK